MNENVNNWKPIALLLIGIIIGGMIAYVMLPQTTIKEVEVTQPGDPVTVQVLEEKLDVVITLVYGAMGASLIAALAAIVSLMQISRRVAN